MWILAAHKQGNANYVKLRIKVQMDNSQVNSTTTKAKQNFINK